MPWKATDAVKERVNFVLEWERRWNEAQGGQVEMSELCRKFGVSRPTGYQWVKRFRDAGHDVRAVEERSRRPLSSPHAILLDRHPEVNGRAPPPSAASCAVGVAPDAQDAAACAGRDAARRGQALFAAAEPMLDPTGDNVEKVLDSAFQEFGLTLEEAVTPPAADLLEQRRVVDQWRREALGDVPPALVYRSSPRRYPCKLLGPDPPSWSDAREVDRNGCFRWKKKLLLKSALAGQRVDLERTERMELGDPLPRPRHRRDR